MKNMATNNSLLIKRINVLDNKASELDKKLDEMNRNLLSVKASIVGNQYPTTAFEDRVNAVRSVMTGKPLATNLQERTYIINESEDLIARDGTLTLQTNSIYDIKDSPGDVRNSITNMKIKNLIFPRTKDKQPAWLFETSDLTYLFDTGTNTTAWKLGTLDISGWRFLNDSLDASYMFNSIYDLKYLIAIPKELYKLYKANNSVIYPENINWRSTARTKFECIMNHDQESIRLIVKGPGVVIDEDE